MAKWYGAIGYADNVEVTPGEWEDEIVEKFYYGDLIRNIRKMQNAGEINDNINLANEISIVADPFAINNIFSMRYVEFMGAKWKISSVEVRYPRLILTVGGLYNVEQT